MSKKTYGYVKAPKYLFRIPWPCFVHCDECGRKYFSGWEKKGFIVTGYRRVRVSDFLIPQYWGDKFK